jgi:aspartate/methionine/tyrosine aminotransferase
MEWAKLHAHARYDLAASGVGSLPLAELPVPPDEVLAALEITGAPGYGYPPLVERLAARAGVEPERVVCATGTSMANHLALASVLEPGDEVLIEQPTYEVLVSAARYLGAAVRRFPRRFDDGWAIDPDAVERAMTPRTRMVVVTNLHNPTGVRTPDNVLAELAGRTERRGARLLVDEVYLEACFDSAARSAVHLGENVLATASLTKAYGLSGVRCGWVLAPPQLAERMRHLDDLYGASAAHPAERLSVLALDHLAPIAERARRRLAANQTILHRFLDTRSDLAAVRPDHGTIVFPQLKSGSVEDLCTILRDRYDTSVVPGRFFDEPAHFRLGLGGTTDDVEEGLRRLGGALDDLADGPVLVE